MVEQWIDYRKQDAPQMEVAIYSLVINQVSVIIMYDQFVMTSGQRYD